MLYKEWASKTHTRSGLMLPVEDFKKLQALRDTGYTSVYAFSEEDALKIKQSGNSSGFGQYEVYSDEIIIDIDNPTDLNPTVRKLVMEGLAYDLYSSGSKGYHIVVPLDKMYHGYNVPYSQRKWVEDRLIKCDTSVYRHGSLISLPGRVHPKTGQKKELIRQESGKRATLQLVDPPMPKFNLQDDSLVGSLESGLRMAYFSCVSPPTEGGRHMTLWKIAKCLAEAGLSYEAGLELLITVNETWPNPKDENEVQRAASSAYGLQVQSSY